MRKGFHGQGKEELKMVAMVVVLALLMTTASFAQAPTPAQEPRAFVLVSYNAANLGAGMDRLGGIQFEADYKPTDGNVVSFTGHVSNHDGRVFVGAGPRATWDLGPVHLFGHYVFGQVSVNGMHTSGIDGKLGGGGGIVLGRHWLLRVGADHDGHAVSTVVGIGARF